MVLLLKEWKKKKKSMENILSRVTFLPLGSHYTKEWDCCRKGDPFQGPKLGCCLTLGNELSEETHVDKARDFTGKGHPGGEQ